MAQRSDHRGFLGQPAWVWTAVALLIGAVLTLLATWTQHKALGQAERAQFERVADRSFTAIESRLRDCGMLVRAVQGVFLASHDVDKDEFANLYANLRPREAFPSLQAMGVARRVTVGGAEHFITDLVEPVAGNERLQGLDVTSQPANMAALVYSRDADEPAMSAAFRLVQREGMPGAVDGVIIRLPVFTPGPPPIDVAERRARMAGSLAVSFRVGDLIASALPPEAREELSVRVVDITPGLASSPQLFRSESADEALGEMPDSLRYRLKREIHYGGRVWSVVIDGAPGKLDSIQMPLLTLLLGAVATLMLGTTVWSLASTRVRATRLAEDMSAQYRDSELRFRALNELLPTLVLLARRGDGRIVYANHAARERLSIPDPEQSGKRLVDLFDDDALAPQIDQVADSGWAMINRHTRFHGANGNPYWVTLSVSSVQIDGQAHLLAVASDITELRELNDLLTYQANHDAQTGLFNRREFGRRLDAATQAVDGGWRSAMLYFDLDQFKVINDTSGHTAGDQLLAQLASLMSSHLVDGETIARLGGDEFGVLIENTTLAASLACAERLRRAIQDFEFAWEDRSFSVSASVGVVMLDRPGMTQRELLSLADTACYMAKERGRNRVHLYSDDDAEILRRRSEMRWASKLRQALAEGRFLLHFQEIVALQPDPPPGVHLELLIRLRDEDGVMVPPGDFIPAAERYGLMPQLDRWVIETAFANFARLHPSGERPRLCAINLSALTIDDDGFPDFVIERLQQHGVPAGHVCFEITETAAVARLSRVVALMKRLRAAACRFSLDDFGAGMASFAYLKNLPVDYIKIDGSFIRDLGVDPMSSLIVRSVTDIGHQLGLQVVAEWVDNDAARDILRDLGVDYAQGYLLHRPSPVPRFGRPTPR